MFHQALVQRVWGGILTHIRELILLLLPDSVALTNLQNISIDCGSEGVMLNSFQKLHRGWKEQINDRFLLINWISNLKNLVFPPAKYQYRSKPVLRLSGTRNNCWFNSMLSLSLSLSLSGGGVWGHMVHDKKRLSEAQQRGFTDMWPRIWGEIPNYKIEGQKGGIQNKYWIFLESISKWQRLFWVKVDIYLGIEPITWGKEGCRNNFDNIGPKR